MYAELRACELSVEIKSSRKVLELFCCHVIRLSVSVIVSAVTINATTSALQASRPVRAVGLKVRNTWNSWFYQHFMNCDPSTTPPASAERKGAIESRR